MRRSLLQSPYWLLILSFMALIAFGTVLLMLPSTSTSAPLPWIDALFTSTSAVCVTGLIVVDTGTAFSLLGQIVILLLIQLGGIGIMTFSTMFLLIAGKRPGLSSQVILQDSYTHSRDRNVISIIKDIALFTITIEGLGVLLIFFCFWPEKGALPALYLSIFHAVSAFCNAGFSLFSDSFVQFRTNWVLLLVMCFLIISGGLGFLVFSEIKQKFKLRHQMWSRLSLHSKLVLSTTALLLITGTLLILFMEGKNTLAALSLPDSFLAAFFQSVNARTSGFNSLPIGDMANESLFVLILLMFIGASPGSCGGGVKTTTIAALAVIGISRLRGKNRPQIFGRSLSPASTNKAISLVLISTLIISAGLMLMLTAQLGNTPHPQSRGKFLELFFELVSAFGTVGLSTGATGSLSLAGKMIIICTMFLGRLGPLAVAIAMSRSLTSTYYYPEEAIMVG